MKHYRIIFMAVLLAMAGRTLADNRSVVGDVTGDGYVNAADVTALADFVLGRGELVNEAAANVNGDATVDIADVAALINIIGRTGNRSELISLINDNAKALADALKSESLNATSQAFAQLMSLIELDKNFIANINILFKGISQRNAQLSLTPVKAGSELAEMGYLAYMTVDTGGYGVRVIFDGKGGCRVLSADNLEFIFPATVDGIGTTLFKVIIKNSNNCYQTVADAKIPNVEHLALINRLPKSFTMTLTALIDKKEQTLSESVVSLELPETPESDYVRLDASSFRITGKQSTYLNDKDASALDFSLSMEDANMDFDYSFTCDGEEIVTNNAQMVLQQAGSFMGQMSLDAFNIADLKSFTIRILNDLTLSGTIADGAAFAADYAQAIKDRQSDDSADALYELVESLNSSSSIQLTSEKIAMPEPVRLCLVKKGDQYTIEPGIKDIYSDDVIPINQLVDSQVMEQFNKPFSQSFTPSGNSAGSVLRFYSAFMRMLPLSGGK